jgi:hypothetical protein
VKLDLRALEVLFNGVIRALATAADGLPVGHRVHTVRHGQGREAWSERLETEVVGIAGLTTDDQYGTAEHGRQHNRRDFQPTPIHAVVVRQGNNRDDGPGGTTVFLTNAPVDKPLQPFDDDDDRRLIENRWTQGKHAAMESEASAPEKRAGGARARPLHPADVCLGDRLPAAV